MPYQQTTRSMELFHKKYGASGPPLLILHGLLGASGNWHTLSSNTFSQHFQVYALDLRNHGRSPHSDTFDYPTMAADLEALMHQHNLGTAYILGHSMGGKAAMYLAADHPERVDRLIVADMAPKAYPPHHTEILEALRALDLDAYSERSEIDAALAERIRSRPVRQFLLKNLSYDSDTGIYSWKMNLESIYRNYENVNVGLDEGKTYSGPTLFIRGGASDYITDDDIPRIKQHFPRAEVVTLPKAGHWVHAEAPKAFADAVLDFLVD